MSNIRHRQRGQCGEPGPYATMCTDDSGHRYAHYDASDDSSWTDDWRDWFEDDNVAAFEAPTIIEPEPRAQP